MSLNIAKSSSEKQELSFDNFVKLLRWRAENNSEKVAYNFLEDGEDKEAHMTYRELDFKARIVGGLLQSIIQPGERVLLLYPTGLDYISSYFGCLYAGVVAVPTYTLEKTNGYFAKLKGIVKDADITVILTNSTALSLLVPLLKENSDFTKVKWVLTDKLNSILANNWKEPNIDSDTIAMLMYTSGSTAAPKGVVMTHGNLIYSQKMIQEGMQSIRRNIDSESVVHVGWVPLGHTMGLTYGALSTTYSGGTYVFMDPAMFLQKPIRWLKAISKYRACISCGPNFSYDLCSQVIRPKQKKELDLSCWKMAMCGSEPIRDDTFDHFVSAFEYCNFKKEAFHPAYGLSEATVIISAEQDEITPVVTHVCKDALKNNRLIVKPENGEDTISVVACGKALLEEKIIVVNPNTLTACSSDEVGEIWVKGPNITLGYWRKPEETKNTFHGYFTDESGRRRGPFLRTGDLGFVYEDRVYLTGRLKDLIIIRGKNHYPKDIELTVENSHPALKECCSAAFSIDVNNEENLIVVNEIKPDYIDSLNTDEVISYIRKAVAENHKLEVFAVALLKDNGVPKTGSHKIQRSVCRDAFLYNKLEVVAEWRKEH